MSEQTEAIPEQETRGGEDIDWDGVRPGEPLPLRIPGPDEVTDGYAGQHRRGG